MRILAVLSLTLIFASLITGCVPQPNVETDKDEFQRGYDKGWQEGYDEGYKRGSSQSITPKTVIARKVTLQDAPRLLDLLPLLPSGFEKVDAASEGMSKTDLGLGDSFSEVQLFLSSDPFQMIYGFMSLSQSKIEQAGSDSMMKDEAMIRDLLVKNLKKGLVEEGVEITGEPEIEISHPQIGDISVLGEGFFSAYEINIGFDTLWFRRGEVYVIFYSAYYSSNRQSLIPLAREIERRLGEYSQ